VNAPGNDTAGNDGNASMPEQVKRPNPWRRKKKNKMIMMMMTMIMIDFEFREFEGIKMLNNEE
jgi:hypothetical protein